MINKCGSCIKVKQNIPVTKNLNEDEYSINTWKLCSQENLRALQARDRALTNKQKEAEDQWCKNIEAAGGNPSEELIKKHRLEQFERQKE